MVKLMIFDCDGVLVSDYNRKKHNVFIKNFLKKHGVIEQHTSKKDINAIIKKQNIMWKKIEKKALVGKISHLEANATWIKKFGLKKPLAKEFVSGDYEFWEKSVKSNPIKGVRGTLDALKSKGYKLAVISNDVRTGAMKRKILSWVGIDKYLDAVYTSHSMGHKKPDKEAYLHIVRRFRTKPCNTLFVGHQDYEIIGAKRAGLKVVCFEKEPHPSADFHMTRFSELLRIVNK